jgi:hypothetical protein
METVHTVRGSMRAVSLTKGSIPGQALAWTNIYYVTVTHFGIDSAADDLTWSLICQFLLQIMAVCVVQASQRSLLVDECITLYFVGVLQLSHIHPDTQMVASGACHPPFTSDPDGIACGLRPRVQGVDRRHACG